MTASPGPWLLAACLPLLCGCYASNVVAREDRVVLDDAAALEWSTASQPLVPGLYESVEIRGEPAASIWKIYYLFESGGRYTGAALVTTDEGLAFQTLVGTWAESDGGLVLDGQPPVPIRHAPDHVLLDAPSGSVALRRVDLQ